MNIAICKQCGKEFELSNSEIDFYKSKNLELPKRCKECRELNKQNGSKKNDRKNDSKKEKTETKKTEQPMEKKSNLSYSSNVEQSKGPKKTVYATVAAVIVAVVAFVGSYFGLDFDTLNVSNSETNSTVQTGTMEHEQEDATVQETEQNRSSSDTDVCNFSSSRIVVSVNWLFFPGSSISKTPIITTKAAKRYFRIYDSNFVFIPGLSIFVPSFRYQVLI